MNHAGGRRRTKKPRTRRQPIVRGKHSSQRLNRETESGLEAKSGMTTEFREEIRQELGALEERIGDVSTSFYEMRFVLLKCVGVGAVTLLANIGAFTWQASKLWHEAETTAEKAEANGVEIRQIAANQIRQEKMITDVAELRTEMRVMRELIQTVRDDVLILKSDNSK